MTTTELEVYTDEALEHASAMQVITATSPADFVSKAAELATALNQVITQQKMFTQIGAKKHVSVEGWTTLGSMLGAVGHGVYAVPDGEPELVEIDGVKGWKATMKAVTSDGRVIGGATGYCMRSEPRWSKAEVYAMAGMAQTRATSRALQQPLRWIVKLAGFEGTPMEEVDTAPVVDHEPPSEELMDRFLAAQKQLLDKGDDRWTTANICETASRTFSRTIERLADLSHPELLRITEGAEAQLVPFGEDDEKTEPTDDTAKEEDS